MENLLAPSRDEKVSAPEPQSVGTDGRDVVRWLCFCQQDSMIRALS